LKVVISLLMNELNILDLYLF